MARFLMSVRVMQRLAVSVFMSPDPYTIGRDRPLSEARRLMARHAVRHLPVVDEDGRVCGLLTEREAELVDAFVEGRSDRVKVSEVMRPDPFMVSPDASIDDVAVLMAEGRYSSAVVVDGGRALGVFTAVDALVALARLVGRRESVPAS